MWGLTKVEQRGRIPSPDLLATLLLMQPRTQFAFCSASAHCQVMPRFFSTRISQILLHRADLNEFISQSLLMSGTAPTLVQQPGLAPQCLWGVQKLDIDWRCDLTSAEYTEMITVLVLLATLLLIQTRMPLAFLPSWAHVGSCSTAVDHHPQFLCNWVVFKPHCPKPVALQGVFWP